MWIDELAVLMPPPAAEERGAVASDSDWQRATEALGFVPPADFRAILDRWGPGMIGGFLGLDTPAPGYHPVATLPRSVQAQAEGYGQLKGNHPSLHPWPEFPALGSFMRLGVTDNGDYLGVLVGPGSPDSWPAAVFEDEYSGLEVFEDLTFGPFLLGIVTGRVRPDTFPDDLWDDLPMGFDPALPQAKYREGGAE